MSKTGRTTQGSTAGTMRSRFRLTSRIACLVAAVLCLWPVHTALLPVVGAMSPFVGIASLLATRTFSTMFVIGFIVAAISIFRRRFFCRWVCPTGLCMDAAGVVGRPLRHKPAKGVSLGGWLLVFTVGNAVLGLPLFLWLDPLALFSGIFSAVAAPWSATAWISAVIFIVLLIACIASPHLWCGRLCPLGALQDILATVRHIGRRREVQNTTESGIHVARRTAICMAFVLGSIVMMRKRRSIRPRCLRPPGAIDEETFADICTRCGNCIRACPYGLIQPDTHVHRWTTLLAPVLTFEKDYCRADCTRCTEVCPSGALARVPLEAKPAVKMGLPRIDMRVCLLGEDRECSACRRWCPYEAIRYVFSEENYTLVPVVDPARCNGCGACQVACPTSPKAIRVLPDT